MKEKKILTHKELAKEILDNIGGKDNILNYMSCMTRLRIDVIDKEKINSEYIKGLDKVKGVTLAGNIFQVILFSDLEKTYKEFEELVGITKDNSKGTAYLKGKRSVMDKILNFTSSVFVPIIPALIASGLIKAICTLCATLGWIDTASSTYQVLNILGDTCLYYYPVYIAFSGAKYLKSNQYLTALIGFLMINPNYTTFIEGITETGATYYKLFGFPIRALTYTSTIFPMLVAIFGVWIVEKLVYKYMPNSLKSSIAPALTIVVALPICLGVLAPLGSFLNDGFGIAFTWIYENIPVLAGLLLGATGSFLVMFGCHMIPVVLAITNFSNLGYDVIYPILSINSVMVGCVALAIALKTTNKEEKSYGFTVSVVSGILGITEPALYGIIMQHKKGLLSLAIVGGISGAVSMGLGCQTTALVSPVLGFPAYMSKPIPYIITMAVTIICGVLVPIILGTGDKDRTTDKIESN